MTDTLMIDIQKTKHSRIDEISAKDLQFGKHFSDHMFITEYEDGVWHNPRIVPFGPIPMSPTISALHYGQAIFEGMKAHKNDQGEVLIFRPLENHKRLNSSAKRMCMPEIPENLFMEGMLQLLRLDSAWVLPDEGCSLYLRPFMFAIDEFLGVRTSNTYRFMILTSPAGSYYKEPVRMKIETKFARAIEGGVGFTKAAGNYGVSLYPAKLAQEEGYHQIIWTDAKEHKYVEEAGMMNVMFVIGDSLVTPSLSTHTILAGKTRDTIIQIARDWNMKVEERKISVQEIIDAHKDGILKEAFGAGTAATVAHICVIGHEGRDYDIPVGDDKSFSKRVAAHLTNIRKGRVEDIHQWTMKV